MMNNLIYSRTGNALQIYDNLMEYTKEWEPSVKTAPIYCFLCYVTFLTNVQIQLLGHI